MWSMMTAEERKRLNLEGLWGGGGGVKARKAGDNLRDRQAEALDMLVDEEAEEEEASPWNLLPGGGDFEVQSVGGQNNAACLSVLCCGCFLCCAALRPCCAWCCPCGLCCDRAVCIPYSPARGRTGRCRGTMPPSRTGPPDQAAQQAAVNRSARAAIKTKRRLLRRGAGIGWSSRRTGLPSGRVSTAGSEASASRILG